MEIKTYKLQEKFSRISFEEGEELYFGDPCYVVPGWDHDSGNDVWEKLCNKMFHPVTQQHPDTGEVYTSREPDFDDRNFRGPVEQLIELDKVLHEFDQVAGHATLPEKTKFAAASPACKKKLQKVLLQGCKPKVPPLP